MKALRCTLCEAVLTGADEGTMAAAMRHAFACPKAQGEGNHEVAFDLVDVRPHEAGLPCECGQCEPGQLELAARSRIG